MCLYILSSSYASSGGSGLKVCTQALSDSIAFFLRSSDLGLLLQPPSPMCWNCRHEPAHQLQSQQLELDLPGPHSGQNTHQASCPFCVSVPLYKAKHIGHLESKLRVLQCLFIVVTVFIEAPHILSYSCQKPGSPLTPTSSRH